MSYFKELMKNIDKIILVTLVIFAGFSMVMISSVFFDTGFNFTREVKMQGIAYLIGVGVIILVLMFDYKMFERMDKIFYAVSIILLLLPFVPGIGVEHGGARGWINLGIMDFQPSELVKILFILIFAKYLSDRYETLQTVKGVLMAGLFALPLILLVMIEPDMGNATIIAIIATGMIFCAGVKAKIIAGFAGGLIVSLPIAYRFMAEYQRSRIDAFLRPGEANVEATYQVWHSKISIGSGQLLGKGLFEGTQKKLKFLPVQQSDFIFAVIGEELGFIGGMALIVLYILFLYRIIKISEFAKDFYGSLIAAGVFTMFAFQIFENIGMTMGITPVTGITLPFISYGGSSIVVNMLAVGLVLNVGIRSKTINF